MCLLSTLDVPEHVRLSLIEPAVADLRVVGGEVVLAPAATGIRVEVFARIRRFVD